MDDKVKEKILSHINNKKPLLDGNAIRQAAGKRIREIYFKQSEDGSVKQLELIFTNFDGFVLTIDREESELFYSNILHKAFAEKFSN